MSSFLENYVGKYRVIAEYDKATNDFVRDEFGNYTKDFDDFYIPLQRNYGKILHYDKDILIIYLSLRKGRDVICQIKKNLKIKDLVKSKLALKIIETDEEVMIYIKDKHLADFVGYIKPSSYGANIDPFDSRNLPKTVKIPNLQRKKFKMLQKEVGEKGSYNWQKLTRQFIKDKLKMSSKDIQRCGYSYCDLIYSKNFWDDYKKFLIKNS